MARYLHDDQHYSRRLYTGAFRPRKRYGFLKFIIDCTLIMLTGGLWLIWIFVREMRNR